MAKINWTEQANHDIDNIIDFFAKQSEAFTKTLVQRIFNKVELLEQLPKLGRVLPELNYENVREIIINNYRIIYHLRSSERIDIVAIHFSGIPLNIDKIKPA